ncbi:MAG: 2-oxoacid:acceptor oxidoreductase family protein [Thermoanaerobacteraceae bacterium]|nr:2-oxoacid:acceptor oxidoreductase family protein [Thermoanaerobacteraceae bacterium]
MNKTWKVVLTGHGGQGLGLAGQILAEAAGLEKGIFAVQNQSYGARARGGKSETTLIISPKEIIFPVVERPNLIVALASDGYHNHRHLLEADGLVVYDREAVSNPRESSQDYGFPLLSTARRLGNEQGVTILALGVVCRLTGIANPGQVYNALKRHFNGTVFEKNWANFKAGMELAAEV